MTPTAVWLLAMASRTPSKSRSVALAAALAAAGFLSSTPAGADAPPIKDPSVSGYLGFCDTARHQVRGGLLAAAPFAWTTVSSVPAPAGYEKGKTSISAFQPRKEVDPIDWSGKLLTAASTFTDARHPMASATRIDSSFSDFTGTYTPQVQGLFQLRMYFTGVNKPMYSGDYPAVLIKVTGGRWTQIGGGPVDCRAGTSRSVELDSLPAARLKLRNPRPSPQTAEQLRLLAAGRARGSGAPSSGASTAGAATSAAAAGAAAASPVADATSGSDSGSTAWVWLGGGAVLIALSGLLVLRRRRSVTGE